MINKLHGLSPSGGLVSPSGFFSAQTRVNLVKRLQTVIFLISITILGYFKLLQSTSYTWMKNIGMKNRSGVKNSRDEEIRNKKSFKCLDDMYTYLFFLATLTRYFITVKLRTNIRYHYIIILIYTMFDTLNTFLNLFIKHLLLG